MRKIEKMRNTSFQQYILLLFIFFFCNSNGYRKDMQLQPISIISSFSKSDKNIEIL